MLRFVDRARRRPAAARRHIWRPVAYVRSIHRVLRPAVGHRSGLV